MFEVVVREPGWRARQPAVDDRLSQCPFSDDLQLDENGGVPLEVWNGEEGIGIRREHSLFLRTVKNADGEDRSAGHRRIAEARDVRLAERPFPGESLAAHEPGALAIACAFGDRGKSRGQPGYVVNGRDAGIVVRLVVVDLV